MSAVKAEQITKLELLYHEAVELRATMETPAIARCLGIVIENLHWALWLQGVEEGFVPLGLSEPNLPNPGTGRS